MRTLGDGNMKPDKMKKKRTRVRNKDADLVPKGHDPAGQQLESEV